MHVYVYCVYMHVRVCERVCVLVTLSCHVMSTALLYTILRYDMIWYGVIHSCMLSYANISVNKSLHVRTIYAFIK